MRILHLTRDLPPRHRGGISTAVGDLVRAQVAAAMQPAVVSFDDWRPRAGAGVPAAVAPTDGGGVPVLRVRAPAQLGAVAAFAVAARPHLLHVHHAMLWEVAASLRARLDVPAVVSVHVVQRRMNALRRTAERTLSLVAEEASLAAADRIIVPSRAAADALAGGAAVARVRVVPHGVEAVSAPPPAPAAAAPVFLAAGRFGDVKGTPELFAAVPRVLTALPGATWTIVGGVPANRRAERRWLAEWERAAPAALRPRVRFVGWVGDQALDGFYAAASAVVVPSRFETFGLVALEAMRRGRAVAATAAGGLAELIAHGETGLLSPVGNVAALVEHAVALGRDPRLRDRLGAGAAAAVRRGYLWPDVLPRLAAVYGEVC